MLGLILLILLAGAACYVFDEVERRYEARHEARRQAAQRRRDLSRACAASLAAWRAQQPAPLDRRAPVQTFQTRTVQRQRQVAFGPRRAAGGRR